MPEPRAAILCIEDDETSARLLERLLTVRGYRFVRAATGLQGIELAGQEQPDMILMDINLPDIDGLAITTRLRALPEFQVRPIVAVSAHSEADGPQLALASGCDGFIAKPINIKTFHLQIEQFLHGHQERLSAADERTFMRVHAADLVQKLESRVRELAEANQQLRAIDRQRAHFFNVISHELRTPFTPIRGYVELLRDGALGPLTPRQQQAVNLISTNLTKALRLLDDLLDLSKLKSTGIKLSPESFKAGELLAEVAATGLTYIQNDVVTFITEIAPDLPTLYADKNRLRQVILNLLHNAAKFTTAGSITLAARLSNGQLQVSIQDTGTGLLPEEIPQVFQEFWQSQDIHATGIGTGLGLAISKHLIEAHRGRIWLESQKGVGTRVSFEIPVVPVPQPGPLEYPDG